MMRKSVPFIGLFFIAVQALFSQEAPSNWCGTTGKSPWLEWYQQNRALFASDRDVDTSWLLVPVTVQIVGRTNGTGYYPEEQAMRAVCEMNDQYKDAHIRFYLQPGDPFRHLNNSSWYEHDWNGGSDLIQTNRIDGRLNAFVVADPAGNCGYSWQDAIVLGSNCSGSGNSTWAHEAGHHLSLPHPFYGWEGYSWDYNSPAPSTVNGRQVERIDGSNCHNSGDGFCDTRPDYLNYRWSCNGDYESTVLQKDPDGTTFRSDATLIMGYSLDACASRFTPEQIEAMRANLNTEHSDYLQITTPGAEVSDDQHVALVAPLDTALVQYNSIQLSWNALPEATLYQVEIGLFPSFIPKLYTKVVYTSDPGLIAHQVLKNMPNNRVLYWRVKAYNEWDLCNPNTVVQTGVFKTQNLTATNDLERVTTAELMPNPVAQGLPAMLNMVSEETMEAELMLSDMGGKICQRRQLRIPSGDFQLEIPTDNLAAGSYILTIRNEKGLMNRRLDVIR